MPPDAQAQALGPPWRWAIAPINVTPFIAIETTLNTGEPRVTRRCVLKARVGGAVGGRRDDARTDHFGWLSEDSCRHRPGVIPKARLKCRVRWLWSANPACWATEEIGAPTVSAFRARSSRRSNR